MAFQVGDRVGDYEVIGVLGAGGMGKVYKVRNVISDRIEAMKVLLPNLADDPALADRFMREIKVLASLNHPNIAALYTALRAENQLIMIVEFVDGVTLDDLSKLGRIPLRDAVGYIRQALAALSYAHAKGVIHRDFKPGNLMLTPQSVIKLMDFGIAKSTVDRKLTSTGMTLGSLYYMSPEQVRGTEVDARSDLYSAGMTLYELVTGAPPFKGLSQYDLMIAQIQQAPPPPIQVDPNLPQALNDVILRSLEKDPASRFQTAEEFRAALGSVVGDRPTGVPTPAWQTTQPPLSQPSQIHIPLPAQATMPPAGPSLSVPQVVTPSAGPPLSLSQPAMPSAATSPSPPLNLRTMPMPASRRGMYRGVWVLLAIALIAVLATQLPKFFKTHRRSRAAANVEVSSNETTKPLPEFLALLSGDMVLVEGGDALVGQDRHTVRVESFYIDKTEVTNGAYLMFCRETGHPAPPGAEQAPSDYPVVNVTFYDAQDFAGWAKKRLPTAVEWEKAARGVDGRAYPWGNDVHYEFANIPRNEGDAMTARLSSATAYLVGASPYGALNMMGNAWEWVNTPAQPPTGAEFLKYKEMFRSLKPPLSLTEPFYQARGGSYRYFTPANQAPALLYDSSPLPARAREPDVGFRCAKNVD
jgi:serine/threonine-protein kinase